jgi:ADP-heptose:LPS heptosyltransferase/SAM-dependent methyltransferase
MSTVAILKPDHLGDLVLSVPAIRAVQAACDTVGLFVASGTRTLAHFLFPDIEAIHTADLRHLSRGGTAGTPHEALVEKLNEFDRVLVLRDDPVMREIAAQLRVPCEIASGDHLTHETSIQKQAAARLCGPYSRTLLFSGVPHAWPASPRHVALCVAAGFPTNRWANAQWTELALRLHAHGIRITLLGGPGERDDLRLLSRLLRKVEHDVIVGGADFAGLFEALAPVDLVIATDGGTAHICSLRKPVCSIFGSSPWRRYAPFGRANVLVTRDEPCSPCVQFSAREVNGCVTRECMARIEPAQVVKVVLSNGIDFSTVAGVRVERGASHRYEVAGGEGARRVMTAAQPAPPTGAIDLSDSGAVGAFVEATDRLGGAAAAQAAGIWRDVTFVVPDWLRAKAAQVHPLSQDYADVQNLLYTMITGRPYADLASELTPFDKEQAASGLLAYPNRTPKNLNTYFHAMAKLSDQFDGDGRKQILDLGSGWGFTSEYMARLGHRVVAVDINPDFVEVARRRSDANRLDIDYRIGRFDNLPLHAGESFDVIMTFESFHHSRVPFPALQGMVRHLRADGQVILAGEPFIERDMWPAWGLRLDPLSVYCIARFGWWESGWTRQFMGYLFRGVGLQAEMADFQSDMERYLIGRRAERFGCEQIGAVDETGGWRRDREYLISTGRSTLEFLRPLKKVVLSIQNFAPHPLAVAVAQGESQPALTMSLAPGSNRVEIPLDQETAGTRWTLTLQGEVWCPDRVLNNGDRSELSFHLSEIEEVR